MLTAAEDERDKDEICGTNLELQPCGTLASRGQCAPPPILVTEFRVDVLTLESNLSGTSDATVHCETLKTRRKARRLAICARRT